MKWAIIKYVLWLRLKAKIIAFLSVLNTVFEKRVLWISMARWTHKCPKSQKQVVFWVLYTCLFFCKKENMSVNKKFSCMIFNQLIDSIVRKQRTWPEEKKRFHLSKSRSYHYFLSRMTHWINQLWSRTTILLFYQQPSTSIASYEWNLINTLPNKANWKSFRFD